MRKGRGQKSLKVLEYLQKFSKKVPAHWGKRRSPCFLNQAYDLSKGKMSTRRNMRNFEILGRAGAVDTTFF